MATLYEQIQQALNEDINTNELLSLRNTIKASLNNIGNKIGEYFGSTSYKTHSVKESCEDLADSLSTIIKKLIELENRIDELENKGL